MTIPEYNTELVNSIVNSFTNIIQRSNESSVSVYEYLYDSTENHVNNSMSNTGDSQHLATILQQLFSKMSDNQTTYNIPSSRKLSPSSLSLASSLPQSSKNANSYYILSIISLWFVLIVNPIVILFGVIGNLLTTYILINASIVKLPVSFYTIMLNISDTLNLLIPVLIFWLDNCFNRTFERGYFRDRSNFLCKALMCPDQLFAALSAWYMCAISFNRWCSVYRPSSYFFNSTSKTSTVKTNKTKSGHKTYFSRSFSFCFPIDYCFCLTRHIKYRQHLRAFRGIGIITLIGILCCLYPIFMHELRPVISTDQHEFDLTQKITRTYAIVWKRCYYSQKHEYAYDIIGIILSSFLHILPLTSVAAMNIMIIVRLKERQRMMSSSTNTLQSTILTNNDKTFIKSLKQRISSKFHSSSPNTTRQTDSTKSPSIRSLVATHKDQEVLTDSSVHTIKFKHTKVVLRLSNVAPRRHQSRDRTITIMLVSVALSYLILTLPYRLFWSYNVYIKRMYPEKLNSSVYLLKMHYIDHVLRTIRNIHYGTNFIFFIFLSKPFRRKFRQLFFEKCLHKPHQFIDGEANTCTNQPIKSSKYPGKFEDITEHRRMIEENNVVKREYSTKNSYNETPSLVADARMQEDGLYSIVNLEHNEL